MLIYITLLYLVWVETLFYFVPPPSDTLHLVSGDVHFLNDQFDTLRHKKYIYCTDVHKVYRRLPLGGPSFSRLSHKQVGGASTFQVLWSSNTISQPQTTALSRCIGDFLDYKLKPSKLPDSVHPVSYKSLLPISQIHGWISFPTHFRSAGIGFRQLSVSELVGLVGLQQILAATCKYY